MESLSFRQLQEKCMNLGLSPCAGKGVNKSFLISLLSSAEAGLPCTRIHPKERIKRHDKEFYLTIRKLVKLIPDMRPQETLKHMKQITNEKGELVPESQNNWQMIADELDALGFDEESQSLFDAINDGEIESIKPYFSKKDEVKRALLTYPGLMWLMTKISPEETVYPLYIAHEIYLKEIELKYNYIRYISNKETAEYFFYCRPFSYIHLLYYNMWSIEEIIEKNDIGKLYWVLSCNKGNSCIHYLYEAVKNNNLKAIKIILTEYNVDPNNNKGIVLWVAVFNGFVEAFNMLLSHPCIIPRSDDIINAIERKNIYFIQRLMNHANLKLNEEEKEKIREMMRYSSSNIREYVSSHPKMRE